MKDNNPINRRHFLTGAAALGAASLASNTIAQGTLEESAMLASRHPLSDQNIQWDITTDVLVAGSGAGGTAAAIDARRAGREVLVLEMLPKMGGSSAMSGGVIYMGGGTPLQKALGIEDSVEAMYEYIRQAGAQHPQTDKIRLYCEESINHYHWMESNNVPFNKKLGTTKGLPGDDSSLYYSGCEKVAPFKDKIKPAPRGHVPGAPGWNGGRLLMERLHASAIQQGVKFLTNTASERLILSDDGSVAGLEAKTSDGISQKIIRIKARKGVVLACGGFIHNRDMLERHAPELFNASVPWGNAGDLGIGIQMGMSVGGEVLRMHHGFAIMPLYEPTHILNGMVVNQLGQRFINEDIYHGAMGHDIAYHQKGIAYLITDKESQYGYEDYRVVEAARANSISELETKLGMAPKALTESVDYYNRHAARGKDPLLGKGSDFLNPIDKAPYIAYDLSLKNGFFPVHTFGGLHTDIHARVINAYGEVIPGLYAAGRTSAGLPTAPYNASGLSVGDASFFGRMAGQHAAGRKA
jgi:succinate dehydrogenase/fumarate reductase flavoprotein subunit